MPAPNPKCQQQTVDEAKKAQRALADFAVNAYKNASQDQQHQDKNQIISPVSIALALAMLENGANGQSQQELRQQLIENVASEEVLAIYSALQKQLEKDTPNAKLQIANAIFHDQKTNLKQDYQQSTQQCLEAEVDQVDFQNQPEQARQKINQFVSQKTNNKIQELIKKGQVNEATRIVLANAIYLKAAWQQSFDKKQTKQQTFYRQGHDTDKQQVQMMNAEGQYRHSSNDQLQVVELKHDQADTSMFVILPKQRDGLKQVERDLSGDKLRQLIQNLSTKQVQLQLPRFAVRSNTDLKQVLQKMGVNTVFSDNADLSRMTDERLKISQAVHEAYIKVDEDGTEAAAATSIHGATAVFQPQQEQFIADHPFLYTIVHNPTGAIVFIGRVNDVQEQADE
jgi:serpin B